MLTECGCYIVNLPKSEINTRKTTLKLRKQHQYPIRRKNSNVYLQ